MSGSGDSLDGFLERGGEGDLRLGDEGMLSSPEESPPARARSSASRSAIFEAVLWRTVKELRARKVTGTALKCSNGY